MNQMDNVNKKRLLEYSANVKNYAKWFEISDVKKVDEGYTSYKVVYRFLPKDLNDSIKEIIVWKRFRDFKDLNQHMNDYHLSLHRRDKFPEFPRSKYFGRFDENIIEERRQSSLRLLQFIGSQSHLYKHDKFIEFLLGGDLNEKAALADEDQVLVPTITYSAVPPDKSTSDKLNDLETNLNDLISKYTEHESISHFLKKSSRYLNSAIENEKLKEHFASSQLLKSAANNLEKFLNDVEEISKALDRTSKLSLRDLISKLKKNAEEIQNLNLDLDGLNIVSDTNTLSVNEGNLVSRVSESNMLNDWILSDFNLSSNDFNSELTFISGSIIDLDFSYQLRRTLNANCLLMKERDSQTTTSKNYVLKSLRKSSSPNVNRKILVPKIKFMCQLIKYYETDNTIFLLLEYFPHGKLFNHLSSLLQNGALYLKKLSNTPLDSLEKAQIFLNRRKSLTLKLNSSFTNLESAYKPKRRSKSFRMSAEPEIDYGTKTRSESFRESRKDLERTSRRRVFSPSSSSMSSTDSSREKNVNNKEKTSPEEVQKIFFVKKSDSSSSYNSSDSTTAYKNQVDSSKNQIKIEKEADNVTSSTKESIFTIETRKWLAQLLCAIEKLHEIDVICKDLHPDNLLLGSDGDLSLTFFSKWNLVDDILNKDAVEGFYVAPEMCGLVNYPISQASDFWSFGVLAYELLTMNRFNDMNPVNQLYVDSILFPTVFTNDYAKDLIRKLLCLDPNQRLQCEQIKNHSYFACIDWLTFTS